MASIGVTSKASPGCGVFAMSDQVEQVEKVGFGTNLMESIKGVAIGGILFLASFWVLWLNEGRVDLSEVAKKSVEVKADSVDKSADGKLVSVTGELQTDEKLEDPQFLKPGSYLKLDREVEMFAWVERRRTETTKKVGGSKEVRPIPTYEKKWTSDPQPPGKLLEPKDHENPPLTLQRYSATASKAQIGAYTFNVREASVPSGEPIKLTDDMLTGLAKTEAAEPEKAPSDAAPAPDAAKADDAGDDNKASKDSDEDAKPKKKAKKKRSGRSKVRAKPNPVEKKAAATQAERKAAAIASRKPVDFVRASDTYLFKGSGSLESPDVGDVRVSFRALSPGVRVTLFGQQKDGAIQAYVKDNAKLFRAVPGEREEAIRALATEHRTVGWFLRILGFLMMWIGLMMFFGPINAFLDVIPFLGSAGRVLIGIAMFPISLVLTILTVVLSIIFHNPILLTLFLVGLGAGGYMLYRKKKYG